jgi:hypothetical protein
MSISRKKKYQCDEFFFNNIDTEEKAYWLGFFIGDGCVVKDKRKTGTYKKVIRLFLQKSDEYHIVKFLKSLKSNHTLKYTTPSVFYHKTRKKYYKRNPQVGVEICSNILVDDLINLGVVPNKTKLGCIVPDIRENLLPHFIRGLFDADGSIELRENKLVFRIIGDVEFITKIQKIICANVGINLTKISILKESPHMGYCRWGGNIQCQKIYNWLYKDANIYLSRKFIFFNNFFKTYKSPINNYSTEELNDAVKNSNSLTEAIIKLGYKNKYNTSVIKKKIIENNIDISHFTRKPKCLKNYQVNN